MDSKIERKINQMSITAWAVRLGTIIKDLYDRSISVEEKASYDGAVEDLGEFYKGVVASTELDTTFDNGFYVVDTLSLYNHYYSWLFVIVDTTGGVAQVIIDDKGVKRRSYTIVTGWLGWKYTDKLYSGTKTATSGGAAGQMSYDADYFYVCTATDTWIRFAKTAWE